MATKIEVAEALRTSVHWGAAHKALGELYVLLPEMVEDGALTQEACDEIVEACTEAYVKHEAKREVRIVE